MAAGCWSWPFTLSCFCWCAPPPGLLPRSAAEFINYYADQATSQPVSWTFLSSNAEFHVLEWVEGAALPEKEWQAPPYCFTHPNGSSAGSAALEGQELASGRMYRLRAAQLHEAAAERQQVRHRQQQQVHQQLDYQAVQSL